MANRQDDPEPPHSSLSTFDPDDNLKALVKHEDVFVERSNEIHRAVETTIENYGPENAPGRIYNNIDIAITGAEAIENYDEDELESLRDAILGYIHSLMLMESGSIEYVESQEPSPELQSFLINSLLEHGPALERINFYQRQGRNWWSHINTDRVLDEESIKHKHTFTVDRDQEVKIDSSPRSDWVLVEHLLNELVDTLDIASADPGVVIDLQYFEQVRRHMYLLEEWLKQSEADIDIIDRDEILEAVVDAIENQNDQQ